MKNTLFLLAFLGLFFAGCTKEPIECTTASVRLRCTSSNPYNVYVDGVLVAQVAGGSFKDVTLKQGVRVMKAEQVSGFLLYPTIVNQNISVVACEPREWSFP